MCCLFICLCRTRSHIVHERAGAVARSVFVSRQLIHQANVNCSWEYFMSFAWIYWTHTSIELDVYACLVRIKNATHLPCMDGHRFECYLYAYAKLILLMMKLSFSTLWWRFLYIWLYRPTTCLLTQRRIYCVWCAQLRIYIQLTNHLVWM